MMMDTPSLQPGSSCDGCRVPRAGLIAVLLVAAAARLIGLSHLDVWMDEVYSHIASSELLPKLLRWETPGNESSSPLPFIEMKFARQVFGEMSPLSLRLPSALHGILAVGLLYVFVGRTIGWAAAFWSAMVMALHPFALEWSREGRMYTQWLSTSLFVGIVAFEAVKRSREATLSPLDWRWWLLGISFMLVHAANVVGAMTIAVTAAWLGLMGVAMLARQPRHGVNILLGSVLAGAVYLASWGLTGIAKMLLLLGHASPARGFTPPSFSVELMEFLRQLAGNPPTALALFVWAIAAVGLALAARQGRWPVVLLLVGLAMAGWLSFPNVSKSHFFAPRYVYTALIAVSVGLGVVLANIGKAGRSMVGALAPATPATILLLLVLMWWPWLSEVFRVPKMAIRAGLAPIQQHAAEGDAFILVPDWYVSFKEYKPYDFGKKVKVVRGPKEARYDTGPDESFDGNFEKWAFVPLGEAEPQGKEPVPAATWLFLLRSEVTGPGTSLEKWEPRLTEIERLLAVYGLTKADLRAKLTEETYTLTCRLSRDAEGKGVIDHIVSGPGRRFR